MKKRILIIDDKAENIALANKQLGSFCTLLTATTFSAAKALLKNPMKVSLDAVFTDVMLPGEPYGISQDNPEIGKEVPYGLVIALMALNEGIEAVSLVSDLNHHSGPIASALDNIGYTDLAVTRTHRKDWLDAYFFWFGNPSEEQAREEQPATPIRKKVLVIGKEAPIQGTIGSTIIECGAEYLFLASHKKYDIISCISNRECTHILHVTELDPRAENTKFYEKELHDLILSLVSPEQKVLAAGFMDYDGPEKYARLPILKVEVVEFIGK